MQDGRRSGNQSTRISDLRASVLSKGRESLQDAPAPPKPSKKGPKRESEEERALKAERQALAQHRTSLLAGGNSKKPYLRPAEREERRKGGLLWQLVLVIIVAGGVAYALDPSIVPAEWTAKAHQLIGQYIKL